MKERPIIFKGESIKAILDGRKTMERRIIKNPPEFLFIEHREDCWFWNIQYKDHANFGGEGLSGLLDRLCCPWKIGDQLWVRETWGIGDHGRLVDPCINYRADGHQIALIRQSLNLWSDEKGNHVVEESDLLKIKKGWRSPIHMPRWASRITLEIINIRVERVQEITEEDAIKASLWEFINGKGAWERNDFCWVIEFKKL